MQTQFNGRLALGGLCSSKAVRFIDEVKRSKGSTDLTSEWLFIRINKLLLPGNFIACETCGMSMTFEGITIDHKIPKVLKQKYRGNINETDNLQIICPTCNSMKGQTPLEEFLKYLEERNAYIFKLRIQQPKAITAPPFPDLGLGVRKFGDRSRKKFIKKVPSRQRRRRHVHVDQKISKRRRKSFRAARHKKDETVP